jgi:hypothetical protein
MKRGCFLLPLLLAACSANADPNSLMGGGGRTRGYSTGDDQTSTPKPKPAGSANNGSTPTPQPSSTTPPTPTGSSSTPPPPPPPPPAPEGSCGNPKCAGISGLCGCRATDSAGNLVLLGCSDGSCVCTTLDQVTDGPVDEGGACGDQTQMKALFTSTCTCL